MACVLCSRVPDVPKEVARLVVTAAHDYMLDKFVSLYGGSLPIEVYTGRLEVNTDLDVFLESCRAEERFTPTELRNIHLLPVARGEDFSWDLVRRAKPFDFWLTLHHSADLMWILRHESLVTYFQPIVRVSDGTVAAHECLTRGIRSDGTLYPPNQMFQTARRTDTLNNLDRQCRMAALRRAHEKGLPGMIFINFTPSAIYNPEFCLADTIARAEELKLDPSRVVFEVVESDRIEDVEHLLRIFEYYKRKGFKIALDDVGSGYSSLNLLVRLRPDVIKIDRELVQDIDKEPLKRVICQSLVRIARSIDAEVLAEGIETPDEYRTIQDLNFDLAQGYLIGKPTP